MYSFLCHFFLANFYPSGPFSCICPKTSFEFFPVLVVADIGSCVGPRNKLGQPASSRFLVGTTQVKNDVKLDHRPTQPTRLRACSTITMMTIGDSDYTTGPVRSVGLRNTAL